MLHASIVVKFAILRMCVCECFGTSLSADFSSVCVCWVEVFPACEALHAFGTLAMCVPYVFHPHCSYTTASVIVMKECRTTFA
jgi:hypothetical protein